MNKMTNLSELFAAADDETLKKVADSHPMVSDTKKEELCARISERINAGEEHADFVSGVEVRRGRGTSRFVGFAAALALVLGGLGGGGLLLKNRMGAAPAAELEESAEVTEAETEAATEADTEEYEAVAKELTDTYLEFFNKVYCGSLDVDTSETLEMSATDAKGNFGGNIYYLVTEEGFTTLESIQKRCDEICDEDCGKTLLNEREFTSADDWSSNRGTHFVEKDGRLYMFRELHDHPSICSYVSELPTDTELDENGVITTSRTYTFNESDVKVYFTIVNTDNGWRIADIKPVYTEEEYIAEAPAKADSEDYEAAARELTDEYYRFIDKMCGQALDIDRSVTLEKEEADSAGKRCHCTYFLITDDEFPNAEAARERCFEIFSEDGKAAATALVITPDEEWDYYSGSTFIDKGDCWYILEQFYDNSGVHTWSDDDEFSAELTPDGDIRVVRKTEYVCAKARYEERREFTLRKTDDGWRISELCPVEQKIVSE
ncbi:MAG: hypothetical protein K6G82_06125 [Ruminococcus sp.]|nr:hypothetical protein [Ruminococcus sp.]